MRTLLLRPGSCADTATARYLSLAGRSVVRGVLRRVGLEAPALEPSAILSAAAPDCVQTAELAAFALDYLGEVRVMPALVAPTPPQALLGLLLAQGPSIVIVADEPFLSALGAALAGRPSFPLHTPGQASLLEDRRPVGYWRDGASMQTLLLA